MKSRSLDSEGSNTESEGEVPKTNQPIDPPGQAGRRKGRVEFLEALAVGDRELIRQEGYFASEKLVWLRTDEQVNRPDRAEREESAGATFRLAWPYLADELNAAERRREGLRKGGLNRPKPFASRREEIQRAVERVSLAHPSWRYRDISRQVARQFACSERTVRRYSRNPLRRIGGTQS